jgi:hypothetical protein
MIQMQLHLIAEYTSNITSDAHPNLYKSTLSFPKQNVENFDRNLYEHF